MKNFLRALRCAWPYRTRLAVSILCAILAAIFWGLNFTAIYPVLKIISSNQNLQQWVDGEITRVQNSLVALQKEAADKASEGQKLEHLPQTRVRDNLERKLTSALQSIESRLEAARSELYRYQLAKKYIDMIFPDDPFQTLALVIGLVLLAVAIKGVFEFWQETLVGSVVNLSLRDLRNRFFRQAVHLDVQTFHGEGTHEVMSRFTNDMELLGAGQKTLFGRVIAEPLKALACVVIACWISWQLTLLFLVLVPLAIFVLARVGRVMKRASRHCLEKMSSIYKILQETFAGIRVVKAFTREPYERRRIAAAVRDYYRKSMRLVSLDALSGPLIEFLGVAAIAVALLAGAYLVLGGHTELFGIKMTDRPLETESLLQLYALLAAIADPVRKLSSVYTKIQSGAAASDRIFAFIDRQPRVQANSAGPRLERHQTAIEFRDVCFSYEPSRSVLTGINLHVRHGETIAIVGKNGSGKTSLVNLLPRFYDPDHGSVLIDGLDIRAANLRSLRRQVGLVTQDTILFDDTIHNNIAYGRRRATREEVEEAARLAHAHDFIVSKLPQGYETRVGEAGVLLAGGQKQRLALARVLLLDPSILVLDEFTSAADAEHEAEIHKALREFRRGRTVFVIAHRLNTLEVADRIVVLDGGRIAAVGTHEELIRGCSVYQRLHEAHGQRLVA
ncbi:MAG: ABC transporter ATP-binding protein/permease [Gemmataceae bacterium]|nr:ABC transporter ATP-binding protein/permease [Gemmataceae bacterium]